MADKTQNPESAQASDEAPWKAQWGAEDKRLREIRKERETNGQCIFCGKPLGFFDKRAKRNQHPSCEAFIE